jgi:branched-chain amino acid transport system permease protein
MLIGIVALLRGSRLGMIIRAGVQDSAMVEALGINVRRVFTIVFALGAGLAGLGGVVAAPFLGVYPGMALEFLLQAFIVVVIGGMGSVPGAALGALIVGLARAYGDQVVLTGIQLPFMAEAFTGSPAIARASTVLIMVIVLLLKPTGLLGKKEQ